MSRVFNTSAFPTDRAAIKGYPRLGQDFEVLAPADSGYNCIEYARGTRSAWVNGPPTIDEAPVLDFYDRLYKTAVLGPYDRIDRAAGFGREYGWQKVALYGDQFVDRAGAAKLYAAHAAVQDWDGTWVSKMGEYGLIRHRTAEAIGGTRVMGDPVVLYVRRWPRAGPIWW